MDLLSQFEIYINAQKGVGSQFILLGAALLVIAIWAHFSGGSVLANGIKTGALICGLLIIAGGFGYRSTEAGLLKKQSEVYEKSQVEFTKIETERMAKVNKDYTVYQIVFGAFIIVSLLIIFLLKNPYWHGIAFAVILLMIGVMIVEAFSHQSIKEYYQFLINK